jgi:tRNA A-37 threonylcarbamoyl transferase component Bud32
MSEGASSFPGPEPGAESLEQLAEELRARAAAAVPAPGLRLGPYELGLELGAGGAGSVWEAWDTRLKRRVAVKILHPHLALSATQLERFRREAQLAATVAHRGLCRVHDLGEEHGLHYLVQDLVPGGRTLSHRIAELRRSPDAGHPWRWAAELFREVARAVAAVHAAGISHRDLKPGNLLLTPDGRPLVSDFGLAAVLEEDELGVTTLQRGTPYYLAPEQVEGRPLAGHRGDVFSLGVSLYEALVLVRPFDGDTSGVVARRILREEPQPPRRMRPGLPRDLETIVLRCLEKDPARRYADAGELADDLDRFLRGLPVEARRPGLVLRGARGVRRHPVRAVIAAATTALLVTGAVFTAESARLNAEAEAEGRALAESLDALRGMVDYMDPERAAERGEVRPEFLASIEQGARRGFADDPLELGRTLATVAGFLDDLGEPLRGLDLQREATELLEEGGASPRERREQRLRRFQALDREWLMPEAQTVIEGALAEVDPLAEPVEYARVLVRAVAAARKGRDAEAHTRLLEAHGPLAEALAPAREVLAERGEPRGELALDLELWELIALAYGGDWDTVHERAEADYGRARELFGGADHRTVEFGVILFTAWKVQITRGLLPRTPELDRRREALTLEMLEAAEGIHGPRTAVGIRVRQLRAECLHETRGPLEAVHAYESLVAAIGERVGPEAPRTQGLTVALSVMLMFADSDRAFALMEWVVDASRRLRPPGSRPQPTTVRGWMQAAERTGRPEVWLEGFEELHSRGSDGWTEGTWMDLLRETPWISLRAARKAGEVTGSDSGTRVAPELLERCEVAWRASVCELLAWSEPVPPGVAAMLATRVLDQARLDLERGDRVRAEEALELVRWLGLASAGVEGSARDRREQARGWILCEGRPEGRLGELVSDLARGEEELPTGPIDLLLLESGEERQRALTALVLEAAWGLHEGQREAVLARLAASELGQDPVRFDPWLCCHETQRISACRECPRASAAHLLLSEPEVLALPGWEEALRAIHGVHPCLRSVLDPGSPSPAEELPSGE